MADLDAIVLATDPLSQVRIAGLTARERAVRVARRVGAARVHVVTDGASRAQLAAWRGERAGRVLVIRADQLVHVPLVEPLVAASRDAIAVVPERPRTGDPTAGDQVAGDRAANDRVAGDRAANDRVAGDRVAGDRVAGDRAANDRVAGDRVAGDRTAVDRATDELAAGDYAGAFIVGGEAATAAVAALARGDSDTAVVARIPDAVRVPHGAIARAPIATPAQRRAAHRLLFRILIKPQDNAITRYLYRPVSMPLTRLLVWTPITPNQISYFVAALVAFGCWVAAHAEFELALLGTIIVLVASYLDCCDGEVARVKLLSSRFGAWVDTVVDELSSVGYMVALGWHCHLHFGRDYFGPASFDPWIAAIAVSVVTYLWCIYCVYYNIIVAVGSANSQDYVGRFEVVPGKSPNSVRLAPAANKAIAPKEPLPLPLELLATYLPYIVRRDFISWAAVAFAALHATHVGFGTLVLGGLVSSVILTIDHVKLRSLRRSVSRRGLLLEAP